MAVDEGGSEHRFIGRAQRCRDKSIRVEISSLYTKGFTMRLEPVTEVVFRRKARWPGGLRHLCGDFRRLAGVLELLSGLAEGAAARHKANDIGA